VTARRKLLLKNYQSPGDVLMLTAAVRDLHACYPGQYLTGVSTTAQSLWDNNPYVSSLKQGDPEVTVIDCHYPLIHQSDTAPYHFVWGFSDYLNNLLHLKIKPTCHRGDVHLSSDERSSRSQIHEITGEDAPFWIVAAGGKYDFTIKWWDTKRYQEVIDYFEGRIQFVQVGEAGHYHPPLRGVIDLRGNTDTRQLLRLTYHSCGVLCGVTFLMHLAAAVPVRPGRPPNRAAVVVAGGREPTQWEAYPHHQFLHTIGCLDCCKTGACWKSRTVRIGDGSEHDEPENLCVDVVAGLPRCMEMISAQDVIRRIEMYYEGHNYSYLSSKQYAATRRAVGCLVGYSKG
jgi:ADP-heptose:LPS heptosyltransferase